MIPADKTLLPILISVLLSACSGPHAGKSYDESSKAASCNMIDLSVRGPVKIILDRLDGNGDICLLVSVNSFSYLTNLHDNPKIMFKLYQGDKLSGEIFFQGKSKKWLYEMQKRPDLRRNLLTTRRIF